MACAKCRGREKLRVLDLYAGLGGWSRAFRERGHDVVTLDLEAAFKCTLTMDARVFAEDPWRYIREVRPDWCCLDVVLASPPCNGFSTAALGHHWEKSGPLYKAKTDTARLGVELIHATRRIVDTLEPAYWWMENPVGMMRKQAAVKGLPRVTVTYCQYGEPYQKPTDLWGRFPPSWKPRPRCRPKQPCHEAAPRGSKTGLQGITAKKHAVRISNHEDNERDDRKARVPLDPGRPKPAGAIAEGDWWRSYPDHYAKRYVHEPKHASWTTDTYRPPVGVRTHHPEQEEVETYRRRMQHPATVQGDSRFDDERAPGEKGPTTAALRALIPYELSFEVCVAAEQPAPGKHSLWAYGAGT